MASSKICAVIPAAGQASRLGGAASKLLLSLGDGETIWTWLRRRLEPLVDHIHVVLSPAAHARHAGEFTSDRVTVSAGVQDRPEGMGHAIFTAADLFDRYDHVLVVWGDQCSVTEGTLATAVDMHRRGSGPRCTAPMLRLDRPYVMCDFDDAGQLVRVLETREGDVVDRPGHSDIGVFVLTTDGLRGAWERYAPVAPRGRNTKELNFLPFLPVLVAEHGWRVTASPVGDAIETRGVNTLEDLAFFQAQRAERRRGGSTFVVGHANSFHDPAIAVIGEDWMFAESIERHMQCKRGWESPRLWYSEHALRRAFAEGAQWPMVDADFTLIDSWNYDMIKARLERLIPGGAAKLLTGSDDDQRPYPVWPLGLGALAPRHAAIHQLETILTTGQLSPAPSVASARTRSNRWLHKTVPDHHIGHAAAAVYTSPFEECVVMVLDGGGEESATAFYHFADNELRLIESGTMESVSIHTDSDTSGREVHLSMGNLYGLVTELCGWSSWAGEEWKVMGLAAYGKPDDRIYDFFRSRVRVDGLRVVETLGPRKQWVPQLEEIVGGFRKPSDPEWIRSADLAHNFQRWFEDAVADLTRSAFGLGLSRNLAYGGGCALNSSANGKLLARSGFDRLHVPSAPADDGNALGAALYEWHVVRKRPRPAGPMSPYLGSSVDAKEIDHLVRVSGLPCERLESDRDLCQHVAQLLADGEILGWMQGRAEYGPRALGNRSILADPRQADMKAQLNARVKFREPYRPTAPSILHEHGPAYFEDYQDAPYMERTLQFRRDVVHKVPAVVHDDGTGRLQSVHRELNPLYHQLLESFHAITGVPILINTSLNVMGKPIVHTVSDAIATLCTTGMDRLVVGRTIFSKR